MAHQEADGSPKEVETVLPLLTRGLFDYAGMFPPASLRFDAALAESAAFPRTLRDPGLVGCDLVVTPEHLARLDGAAARAAGFDRPMSLALVGVAAHDAVAVAAAAKAFNRDRASDDPPQRIASVELHCENGLPDAVGAAARVLAGEARVYVEPKWPDAAWRERLPALLDALEAANADLGSAAVGLKFRCAGATALSHVTLAHVLAAVAAHRLPLKATQGLHHPLAGDPRHGNDHGFLNVAAALRFAQAGVGEEELAALLAEADPAALDLRGGIAWSGRSLPAARVRDTMAAIPFAIGSCSLHEPDGDLAAWAGDA